MNNKAFCAAGIIAVAASATAQKAFSKETTTNAPANNRVASKPQTTRPTEFTFTAFGDAGWAETHTARASYSAGFKKAFDRFNQKQNTLGDINYINWETSIGTQCDQFWASHSPSTYAFLTHPRELEDAIKLGFNAIGLANNHSFDCVKSKEGNGPIQTYRFISKLKKKHPNTIFSGVFANEREEPAKKEITLKQGTVPVTFLSAYAGGNRSHCANISCTINLSKEKQAFADKKRLRILALHSWNRSSHQSLKAILRQWIQDDLVDIAIGTGPHIAETIEVVNTKHGKKILATSLGNFIHPSLAAQPNNAVLQTTWTIDPVSKEHKLLKANALKVSCDGTTCINTGTIKLH